MCVLIGGNEQKPSFIVTCVGKQIFKTTLNATEKVYFAKGKCDSCAFD